MGKKVVDFTDEEMTQRLPVWEVLSDIFVNVEQTDDEFERRLDTIAYKLSKLGVPIQTLEEILKEEIGPVFVGNFSVWNSFPETDGWSRKDVELMMKEHRARKNTLDGWFEKIFRRDPFKNEIVAKRWAGIKKRLKEGVPEFDI